MSPDIDQAATVQQPGGNLYAPMTMTIAEARDETYDTRTLRLEFPGEQERAAFFAKYRVGMFGLYGVPGAGESVFCIASPPTRDRYIECTFRRAGRVTAAIQDREVGQTITFRGPYGNCFPIEEWKGRNIVFIAGGIALPPLRSVIWNVLDRRDEFADVTILYGARTVADLVYKDELADWQKRDDVNLITTVDPGGETEDWKGKIGFVPTVLEQTAPTPKNAVALVCGPPIMIKFSLPILKTLGFAPADTYTTLENRMKCGVGKCGRCNVGSLYVCKDGPVFTIEQVRKLPQDDL
ncbi:MAG TPA: FAD/NAD(P)-binding protein [Phycisphaerae bacterium]|nr:FAD/NAD(P)-binding protein [Phycisphaerae bacterium]